VTALNIQNLNSNSQISPFAGPPAGVAPVGPGPANAGPASPRVTNFAQNMAQDGSAIKGMGANAMGGLFGQGGQGGAPMMSAPSQGGSGYDIDRAVALTRQKIGAGRMTGDDLFAAHLASVGEEQPSGQ
jgi:hypothetical protein